MVKFTALIALLPLAYAGKKENWEKINLRYQNGIPHGWCRDGIQKVVSSKPLVEFNLCQDCVLRNFPYIAEWFTGNQPFNHEDFVVNEMFEMIAPYLLFGKRN